MNDLSPRQFILTTLLALGLLAFAFWVGGCAFKSGNTLVHLHDALTE